MNPLFNELNKNNLTSQFEQFRRMFNGNPKEQVQRLLDTGQMSQNQFEQLSKMATELQQMFKHG